MSFVNGEWRTKLAGGEDVEGAEAVGEFGVGQAAPAVEPAEKIAGRAIPFLRVALQTAGDEVAVGIAREGHAWDNVIEAATHRRKPTQAIETASAFSHMDGVAQSPALQEVHLEVEAARKGPGGAPTDLPGAGGWPRRAGSNFVGQEQLDQMAGFAAFDKTQSAVGDQTAHGATGGVGGQASTTGEPGNGEPEAGLSFETAVPQEMRIDGAVRDGEAQAGNEMVLELFPDLCGVGFIVFHGQIQRGNLGKRSDSRQFTGKRKNKDLTQRAQSPERRGHREKRKSRSLAMLGMTISRRACLRQAGAGAGHGG